MKCKLFGMCVVTLIDEVLTKATNHYTYQMSPKFLINVILCAQPCDPWHHFQENNTQTLWLVQDIQMPWYYWGKIHNLMRPSEWCKIHTLIWGSDWCEQHTTLYTNIECFSFSFLNGWRGLQKLSPLWIMRLLCGWKKSWLWLSLRLLHMVYWKVFDHWLL